MKRHRLLQGIDVTAAAVLSVVLIVILNFLAARFDRSFDWTRQGFHSLDPKTLNLLKGVSERKEKVQVATFFTPYARDLPYAGELRERVERLLDRYKAACPSLDVQHVDPYREKARAEALAKETLGSGTVELNSVVFRCGDRHKSVSADAMASGEGEGIREFKAEDAFTTALGTVLMAKQPVVLYATGHGERTVDAERPDATGFEFFKEQLEREGLSLKAGPLGAAPLEGRADLVVVAGPASAWLPHETDQLHDYLLHGGRILLMLDPVIGRDAKGLEPTGLEALAARWGVTARDELVIDRKEFAGVDSEGRPRSEVFKTTAFAPDCPITRGMGAQTPVIFAVVRPVEPTPQGAPAGIQVRPLVRSGEGAWAKHDLRDLVRGALQPDPRLDRRGPHVLGVQLEVTPPPAPPTATSETPAGPPPLPPDAKAGGRAVVLGDADLASNQALYQGGGTNRDFVFNAVYWLLDRQESMGITAKSDTIKIVMDRDQLRQMADMIRWAAPLFYLLAGILVWWMRRH